jgi:hypothetical protein
LDFEVQAVMLEAVFLCLAGRIEVSLSLGGLQKAQR